MSKFISFMKKFSNSFVSGVVVGLPIYITINDYLFSVARVEGTSMQPTLNPKTENKSDIILLDKWHILPEHINRGDVVAVVSPHDQDVSYIKRVIGLGGDIIRTPRYKHDYAYIPRGHCWIEGDNSRSSLDSNSFGPISLGLIKAKATHIIWPPKRWQNINYKIPLSRMPTFYASDNIENSTFTEITNETSLV